MDSDLQDPLGQSAAAVWAIRSAPVLRGLAHALGNRLHALAMVREILAEGEALDGEQAQLIGEELDAVQVLTDRMRLLALSPDDDPIPCRIADLLPDVLALRAAHVDVFEAAMPVTIDGDPPAVLVSPRGFTQALLLHLLDASADGSVPTLNVSGTADQVTLVIAGGSPHFSTIHVTPWFLHRTPAGVQVTATGSAEAVVRLSLPSLAASRRAERAAQSPAE